MDDLFAATTNYRALAHPTFMENTLRESPTILADGVISSPVAPSRKLPFVATRNIADAATPLVPDRSWEGFADVPLLGPEDLSGADMAAIVAEVLGVPVRYEQSDAADLEATMVSFGASPAMARAMADMTVAKDHGLDVAPALNRILRR